jgi:hypothetical protein
VRRASLWSETPYGASCTGGAALGRRDCRALPREGVGRGAGRGALPAVWARILARCQVLSALERQYREVTKCKVRSLQWSVFTPPTHNREPYDTLLYCPTSCPYVDPYAERMPRADCSSNTIRDSISRVAPSLRGPRFAPALRHARRPCALMRGSAAGQPFLAGLVPWYLKKSACLHT